MKKFLFFSVVVLNAVLICAPSALAVIAVPAGESKTVMLGKNEVVNDDLFISGDEVLVEGTVNGDLYAAGGMVTIRGTVNGDILAAGGNLEISGKIADDIRAAGGNIRIEKAAVGDSVSVAGGNLSIDEETTIGGGLVVAGGTIVSRADVARGVTGGGGSVNLDGKVGKDVYLGAGMLTLSSGADIAGDLVYSSEEKPQFVGEATVSGEIRQLKPEVMRVAGGVKNEDVRRLGEGIFRGIHAGFRVWSFFASLLVGLVMLALFPKVSEEVAGKISKRFFASLGWGLLVFIIAGPALFLLVITVVGIPLAMILGMLFLIDLYVAKLFVALALGSWMQKLLNQKWNHYIGFTLGLVAFYILHSLPWIGFMVWLVALLLGVGSLFQYKKLLWKKR